MAYNVLVINGSPVYYGSLLSFLDRLFYSTQFPKTMKVGDAKAKYGLPEMERGCFTSFPDGK